MKRIREVIHPAVEREKIAASQPRAGSAPSQGQAGNPVPVAAVKSSSAKKGTSTKGYRVAQGAKKGYAIGHEGERVRVKWDDNSETLEQASTVQQVNELREFVRELLFSH